MLQALSEREFKGARKQSWELFERLGLPSKRSEFYRQIPMNDLPEVRLPRLDLSSVPEGVVLLPLQQAEQKYSAFLKGRFASWIKEERDPFAALNGAIYDEGLFLYVPPGRQIEEPIEICTAGALRIQIVVGAGSSIEVRSSLAGEERALINRFVDLSLEEGARVNYRLEISNPSNLWLFDALRATLKKDAHLFVCGSVGGPRLVRSDYQASLEGEGAHAEFVGAALLREEERMHTQVLVHHKAPNCTSRQLFKTALLGESRATFNGKIYVERQAQQTDAFQLNNSLLLSEEAVVHSLPNLEIFADDVKASHGSTVGTLDEELLYYLQSRGLPLELARQMVVTGFLSEAGGYGLAKRLSGDL